MTNSNLALAALQSDTRKIREQYNTLKHSSHQEMFVNLYIRKEMW